jgi:hypothetical protein
MRIISPLGVQVAYTQLPNAKSTSIEIGSVYYHYRDSSKLYKVIDIAYDIITGEQHVFYQAQYDYNLPWLRKVSIWSEKVGDVTNKGRYYK